jgi:hypothetical protein
VDQNAKLQTADQTLKGAIIGLVTYVAYKYDLDMQLIALAIPVVSGVLALISTKVGNRSTACLFVAKDETPKS